MLFRSGSSFSNIPNFQPYLTYKDCGFSAGAWGSYGFDGSYSEIDVFAAYELKKFKLTLTDYYTISAFPGKRFFDFSNKTTGHSIDGMITFSGTKKIPLSLSCGVFFYGFDKDSNDKQLYSTYFEANYSFREFDLFVGGTPAKGLYGSTYGIVNSGLKLKKEIKISNNYSIPGSLSLIANPMQEKVFLVALFTL